MSFFCLWYKLFEFIVVNVSLGDYEGMEFIGFNLKVYIIEYFLLQCIVQYIFSVIVFYYIEGWVDVYFSVFDGVVRVIKVFWQEIVLEVYW